MAEPGDEIAASVPGRALALVRFEQAGLEIHGVPEPHQAAIAERPAQLRRLVAAGDGCERAEIGADRQRVALRHPREVGIGKRRVIVRAIGRDAIAQGAGEIGIRPGADPGVAVGRQVRRIDRAERRGDPLSARERPCRIGGVAARAVAGLDQHLAVGDQLQRRLGAKGRAGNCTAQRQACNGQAGQNRPHRSHSCDQTPASRTRERRFISRRRGYGDTN